MSEVTETVAITMEELQTISDAVFALGGLLELAESHSMERSINLASLSALLNPIHSSLQDWYCDVNGREKKED